MLDAREYDKGRQVKGYACYSALTWHLFGLDVCENKDRLALPVV